MTAQEARVLARSLGRRVRSVALMQNKREALIEYHKLVAERDALEAFLREQSGSDFWLVLHRESRWLAARLAHCKAYMKDKA